jgi:cytosine/creatinine deaminase
MSVSELDPQFMAEARQQAQLGLDERGVPVGSVLVLDNRIIARGRNRRVQHGDPIAHGEMDCIRAAGRLRSYRDMVLYTTLSPCMMCAGTIVQFKISRVVIGENTTFGGNEDFLRSHGVQVTILSDPACMALMDEFRRRYPEIWNEDIGED